jgi:1-phosphofructokinase
MHKLVKSGMAQVTTVTLNPAIDYTMYVPSLTPGSAHRASHTLWEVGGKGFNVARVLRQLGIPSLVSGFLYAEDHHNARAAFESENIAVDCVVCPGRTRVNAKVFDESQRAVTELNAPGVPAPSDAIERVIALVESHSAKSAAVVLSGSLPPRCPADVYLRLAARCRPQCPVVLDASGEALRLGLEGRPAVVKPNRHELAGIAGRPIAGVGDAVAAAAEIAHTFGTVVLASLDSDGAVVTDGADAFAAPAVEGIEVRGTVGAGDSMVAGYVSGLVRALPMEDCFRRAMAAAAVVVAAEGTAHVAPADFERTLGKVQLRRI